MILVIQSEFDSENGQKKGVKSEKNKDGDDHFGGAKNPKKTLQLGCIIQLLYYDRSNFIIV